jgi:hypothetical protein
VESITILSVDLDVSLPQEAMPSKTCSQNLPLLHAPNESPACTSKTLLHPGLKQQNSVGECLKKLHASNGCRNILKRLGYNIVKLLKVDNLLPVFNGDVVFEFPLIEISTKDSLAKLMVGIDKQHDEHA